MFLNCDWHKTKHLNILEMNLDPEHSVLTPFPLPNKNCNLLLVKKSAWVRV